MTIHLVADGEDTGKTLELNAENNWTGSFTDVDAKKSGTAIAYTVTEDAVDGYESEVVGSAEEGYTIKNSHTPKTPQPDKPQPDKPQPNKPQPNNPQPEGPQPDTSTKPAGESTPQTGDSADLPLFAGLMAISFATLASVAVSARKCRKDE
ncbi:Cna B-type domain-containing protein [Curtanaerobium respiraculi]|uniref:Cna B-type domain-containing protein n=1 Tax=Curtanaerobium respiraculi TaxID=2949669 RepID=UPI0024B3B747|nr:Cna B-type domain-containing protein [Curtanaerobium respiraculi]